MLGEPGVGEIKFCNLIGMETQRLHSMEELMTGQVKDNCFQHLHIKRGVHQENG